MGLIIALALRRHRRESVDEQTADLLITLHAPAVEATARAPGRYRVGRGTDCRAMLYARL